MDHSAHKGRAGGGSDDHAAPAAFDGHALVIAGEDERRRQLVAAGAQTDLHRPGPMPVDDVLQRRICQILRTAVKTAVRVALAMKEDGQRMAKNIALRAYR